MIVASVLLVTAGCHRCSGLFGVDRCAAIPPGAIPQPVGTYTCQWQNAQAAAAERDDFVIYDYEWMGESSQLSSYGGQHLELIAERLPTVPFPVLLERTDCPEVDEPRRLALIDFLSAHGYEDAHERVMVGRPAALGAYGAEAAALSSNALGGASPNVGGNITPFSGFRGGLRGGLSGGFSSY